MSDRVLLTIALSSACSLAAQVARLPPLCSCRLSLKTRNKLLQYERFDRRWGSVSRGARFERHHVAGVEGFRHFENQVGNIGGHAHLDQGRLELLGRHL